MKHLYKCLTALLVFAMLATTASFTGTVAAASLDLEKSCALTVGVGKNSALSGTDLYIDVYKIAGAVPASGSYTFDAEDAYGSLQDELNGELTNEAWKTLAQEAAMIALGSDAPQQATKSGKIESKIEGLDTGLYLIVPHGREERPEDYITTNTDKNGVTTIATTFDAGEYTYVFTPSLVAMPSKDADEDGNINTANGGEWLYEVTVTLKAEQDIRFGKLEIVKDLFNYMPGSQATFVFQIEAFIEKEINGKMETVNVYSDVVTISFDGPGTMTKTIDGLPVGATVIVTEVYSGVRYELVSGDEPQMATIVPEEEDPASVYFANDYKESANSGGGITNSFTVGEDGGWIWEQFPFDPLDS